MNIRPIRPEDDPFVEKIIRDCLIEFGADRPGFAWQDPELAALSHAYRSEGSAYFVAEINGAVVGGSGIAPLQGVEGTCELQKMYLEPSVRGIKDEGELSVADHLMERCLDFAKNNYAACYLETFRTMERAIRFYQKKGFLPLEKPLGNTGHGSCDHWFVKYF